MERDFRVKSAYMIFSYCATPLTVFAFSLRDFRRVLLALDAHAVFCLFPSLVRAGAHNKGVPVPRNEADLGRIWSNRPIRHGFFWFFWSSWTRMTFVSLVVTRTYVRNCGPFS